MHNVVVIGGGPAGLMACFWLQKLGIPHVLVEKETYPRDKSCADILTSNAIRCMNEVDPNFIPELRGKGLLRPIYGTDLSTPNNHSLSLPFKYLDNVEGVPSCYSIPRADLDHFLYNKLMQNPLTTSLTGCAVTGVSLEQDCRVVHTRNQGDIQARMVLVATGSNYNPIVKKATGSDKHVAVGIRAYYRGVDFKSNECELFLHEKLMPGGFYIAPMEDGLFNVNMVVRSDQVKKKKLNLRREFESLIETNELLRHRFRNATRVSEFAGSSLSLGTRSRSLSGERYLLLGDSAGLIDLISANGIPQAMLSGKLAAEQVKRSLEQQAFSASSLQQYDRILMERIKDDIAVGKTLNPILHSRTVHRLVLRILNFLTRTTSNNKTLVRLYYAPRPALLLFNPAFYLSLLRETRANRKEVTSSL